MMKHLTRHLFVAFCVTASMTMAPGCGNNQYTFIPNCLPSPESGPNVVAKVRYKVSSEKDNVEETKTFDTKLGDPFELPVNATIKLPVMVELLNADGTVLATRYINDPELVSRSADYPPHPTTLHGDKTEFETIYVSALGNRYQDTWDATLMKAQGQTPFYVYSITKRVVQFVDVDAAAIACTTVLPKPAATPKPCTGELLTAETSQVTTFGPQKTDRSGAYPYISTLVAVPGGILYTLDMFDGRRLRKNTEESDLPLVWGVYAMTGDPNGNLYYYKTDGIHKLTPSGTDTVLKGTENGGEAAAPAAMAADGQGNVYRLDHHDVSSGGTTTSWNDLRKITSNGTVSTLVSKPAAEWPIGNVMAAAADGTVYIAEASVGAIHVVSSTGAMSKLPIAASANLGQIGGMAIDCSGNIYASETFGKRILTITPAGAVSTLAGTGSKVWENGKLTEALFGKPKSLALDAATKVLYVADGTRIRKISVLPPASSVACLNFDVVNASDCDFAGNLTVKSPLDTTGNGIPTKVSAAASTVSRVQINLPTVPDTAVHLDLTADGGFTVSPSSLDIAPADLGKPISLTITSLCK